MRRFDILSRPVPHRNDTGHSRALRGSSAAFALTIRPPCFGTRKSKRLFAPRWSGCSFNACGNRPARGRARAVLPQKFAELGVKPEDIRSLADLRRLPFTTSADLRANYPTGLLAVPLRRHPPPAHIERHHRQTQGALLLAPGRGQRRRAVRALLCHDRRHEEGRVPEHDDLRHVHRRAGHPLRRGKNRLPGHPRRSGQLRAAVDADAGFPDDVHPPHAQLRALPRDLPGKTRR